MGYLTLAKILGPVLIISLLFAHDRRIEHLRAGWQHKTVTLVAVTAEVAGAPKLKIKDAPAAIRQIGKDRDAYLAALTKTKAALNSQTALVVEMGEETAKLRAEADRQAELARKLAAQRDGWIRKAQAAATRTQRRTFEEEAKDCEAAMEALYQAGF